MARDIPPHILIQARWELWKWWRIRRRNKRWAKKGAGRITPDSYITYSEGPR